MNTESQIYSNTSIVVSQILSTAPTTSKPRNGSSGPGTHENLRPTLIHVHADLLHAILGLNQSRSAWDNDVRYNNRVCAARGLARIAASIDDSSRLYAHILLFVSIATSSERLLY